MKSERVALAAAHRGARGGVRRCRAAAFVVAVAGLGTPAPADPREIKEFLNVPSNGVLGSPANATRTAQLAGGYALERLRFEGTLSRVHTSTVPFDARLRVTPPSATPFDVVVFGGTSPVATVSSFVWLHVPSLGDPAGTWEFRFYELFDNGGTGEVDSIWTSLTVTFEDDPAPAPLAVELGVIAAPGLTPAQAFLGTNQVRWFQFDLQVPVTAASGRHLDIDASASTLTGQIPQNDSVMALYDAGGSLVALDDDSGPGFHAQLSFGAGTRPGVLDGRPFAGDNGDLASGRYYLAVGGRPMQAGPLGFEAVSASALTGQIRLDFRTDLPEPCAPDLTTSAIPGSAGYGVPNGVLNNDDFFYFLALFAQVTGCTQCPSPPDLTTTAVSGTPGYGVPNGLVNNDDFFYYLISFSEGC